MKETVELMRFLRHDPVGQRFGVAVLVVAWLAIAWTSLGFAVAVPLLLVISELARSALTTPPQGPTTRELKGVYGFGPFPKRGGTVTNELIDRLREDDAY